VKRYSWAFWLCAGWCLSFIVTFHFGLTLAAYITLVAIAVLTACGVALFRE
jgi:hypothetical protein